MSDGHLRCITQQAFKPIEIKYQPVVHAFTKVNGCIRYEQDPFNVEGCRKVTRAGWMDGQTDGQTDGQMNSI